MYARRPPLVPCNSIVPSASRLLFKPEQSSPESAPESAKWYHTTWKGVQYVDKIGGHGGTLVFKGSLLGNQTTTWPGAVCAPGGCKPAELIKKREPILRRPRQRFTMISLSPTRNRPGQRLNTQGSWRRNASTSGNPHTREGRTAGGTTWWCELHIRRLGLGE